jgi:hypothetical protein
MTIGDAVSDRWEAMICTNDDCRSSVVHKIHPDHGRRFNLPHERCPRCSARMREVTNPALLTLMAYDAHRPR